MVRAAVKRDLTKYSDDQLAKLHAHAGRFGFEDVDTQLEVETELARRSEVEAKRYQAAAERFAAMSDAEFDELFARSLKLHQQGIITLTEAEDRQLRQTYAIRRRRREDRETRAQAQAEADARRKKFAEREVELTRDSGRDVLGALRDA